MSSVISEEDDGWRSRRGWVNDEEKDAGNRGAEEAHIMRHAYECEEGDDVLDEEDSLAAFLLRLLLLNVENPLQISMMLTLYLAICVFSASPTWFGPQTTLSEIYGVENVTDTFIGNYADGDCVAMNAILRENPLLLTLECFQGGLLLGLESLGFTDVLNLLVTLSVTASDTFLNVLSGTAANEEHWGKGPHLYAAAGTTAILLFLLNLRSVRDLYKRQYRKWFHPEEAEHIECLDAMQMHLRTFPFEEQPHQAAQVFGIPNLGRAYGVQAQLRVIRNFLEDRSKRAELRANLKKYCSEKGLLSSKWSFYLVDMPAVLYAMVGAANANYELVKFLTKLGSPNIATAIPVTFSFYAKSCFYGFSLFNIVHLMRNVYPLMLGAIQVSKQDRRYALAVLGAVLGFFAFIPLSGISFFMPANDLLHFFFKNWVEKRTDFYLYFLLPALGAMGSIANSSGYMALCTRLLNLLRKMIEGKMLSDLGVDETVKDVCTILEEIKTQVSKETEPDKQFILFLVDMACSSIQAIRETCSSNRGAQPQPHYVSAHVQDHSRVESEPYVPATAYNPHNAYNFLGRPRSGRPYGTFSSESKLAHSFS